MLFLTHVFDWKTELCNVWITQHKGQIRSLFSCKFVDIRFCRWRPDTSSPGCSSSSPPSFLFAPVAQNTPAWPVPQSRHEIFCQTCKQTPPGHHFISHTAKETLQNPKQIKPSCKIMANAFKSTASSAPTHCDIIIHQSTDIHIKTHVHWCSAKTHTSPIIHEFEDLALRIRWNSSDWI